MNKHIIIKGIAKCDRKKINQAHERTDKIIIKKFTDKFTKETFQKEDIEFWMDKFGKFRAIHGERRIELINRIIKIFEEIE